MPLLHCIMSFLRRRRESQIQVLRVTLGIAHDNGLGDARKNGREQTSERNRVGNSVLPGS